MENIAIVTYFVIFEFGIVAVVLVLTYLLRFYFYFKRVRDVKVRVKIIHALKDIVLNNEIYPLPYAKNLALYLDAFDLLNTHYKHSSTWKRIKVTLVREQLLPIARQQISSKDWYPRYLLIKYLQYYCDDDYADIIIKLINDSTPIISINAIYIAMTLNSFNVFNTMVKALKNKSHALQLLYLNQINSSLTLRISLMLGLANPDTAIRKICYDILERIGAGPNYISAALVDAFSPDVDLRVAAINVLFHSGKEVAKTIIPLLLNDNNWVIRNTVIKNLERFKQSEVLDYLIMALDDPSWWVRVNAAKILAKKGEEGLKILEHYDLPRLSYGYQETEYFVQLNTIEQIQHVV